jgi:hypothetical protein
MRLLLLAIITIMSSFSAPAQETVRQVHPQYMHNAQVSHVDNSVVATTNAPRPLADVVKALSEEYGWLIDFEDPPYYSKYDVIDDTDVKWRAAHPNDKGFTLIAGSHFRTQFSEYPNVASSLADEEHILVTVVSDYNASANPGRFNVVNEGGGRFAIVGTHVKDENGQDKSITSILDTPISVSEETRNGLDTVLLILNALSTKTHTRVEPGMYALDALAQSQVTVGGQNVPARILLSEVFSDSKVGVYWHLYYDTDNQTYVFNVLRLMKAEYDSAGKRTLVLVR